MSSSPAEPSLAATLAAETATALLDDFVNGTLRRVDRLIAEGLPPLDSEAATYSRISDDRDGEESGVGRQLDDSLALAAAEGRAIPEAARFVDNDISASTRSRKPRPSFERLVAYIVTGQVRRVYAYSNSRLTRRPMELELLIRLHERSGVQFVTKASGSDDLSTADGRMVARIKAAVDAAEAERTSERIRRQIAERVPAHEATSGPFYGGRERPFGFLRDGTLVENEAEVVREIFRRYVAGESASSITLDMQARGLTGTAGVGWTNAATRRVLRKRFYVSRGVVDEQSFTAAAQRFTKKPSVVNTRKHLLAGVLTCAECKGPLVSTGHADSNARAKKTGAYTCDKAAHGGCGKVRIMRHLIDPAVIDYVSMLLSTGQPSEPAPEAPDVQPQIDALDARRDQTKAAMDSGAIDYTDGLDLLASIKAQRADLTARQAVAAPTGVEALWGAQIDALRGFLDADVSLQTATVRRHIAAIEVRPAIKKGARFDPRRVEVVLTNGERIDGETFYAATSLDD